MVVAAIGSGKLIASVLRGGSGIHFSSISAVKLISASVLTGENNNTMQSLSAYSHSILYFRSCFARFIPLQISVK